MQRAYFLPPNSQFDQMISSTSTPEGLEQTNNMSAKSFAGLINHRESSDFTIVCHGREVCVHKLILEHRSEYFRRVLNNPNFSEFHTRRLDLTNPDGQDQNQTTRSQLEDDDPYLIHALLMVMYTFDCPSWAQAIEQVDGVIAPNIRLDNLRYYKRVSQLADRFTVSGVDTILVKKIFAGLNKDDVKTPRTVRLIDNGGPRSDQALIEAITIFVENGKRNGSLEAKCIIASWFVDNMHNFKSTIFTNNITELPALSGAIVKEHLKDVVRLQCPNCDVVIRVRPSDLHGQFVDLRLCFTTGSGPNNPFTGEHMTYCETCDTQHTTLAWYRRWMGETDMRGVFCGGARAFEPCGHAFNSRDDFDCDDM